MLALVTDAIMGEVVVSDDEPISPDWRVAVTTIARRTRDVFRRHPWTLDNLSATRFRRRPRPATA